MKIQKSEDLFADIYDKTEYAIHVRNLKQALNHRLVLRKTMIFKNTFLGC